MRLNIALCTLFLCSIGHGQSNVNQLITDMAFYGDCVMNTASSDHRTRANKKLNELVDEFLLFPNSFHQHLTDMPWVSTLLAPDSTFRIITWQLNQGDSLFIYSGRVQMKSGAVFHLTDDKSTPDILHQRLTKSNWYGARYYEIKKFINREQTYYLLFGFNAHSRWNRQKLVDVLSFQNDDIVFGAAVFTEDGKEAMRYGKSRIILTYSLDSRVQLKYDNELKLIIHDHLMPIQGRFLEQGETAVADGTFEGYWMDENGDWIYKERIFEDLPKEPLDSGLPSQSDRSKSLFGRDRD